MDTRWEGEAGTYGGLDELSFDEFEKACTEDLVDRFFGWKVDVLDDICPVDERRVYTAGVGMRVKKMEWSQTNRWL